MVTAWKEGERPAYTDGRVSVATKPGRDRSPYGILHRSQTSVKWYRKNHVPTYIFNILKYKVTCRIFWKVKRLRGRVRLSSSG